jgi:hypothetical protein
MAANFLLEDEDDRFCFDISFKDNKISQNCARVIPQRAELTGILLLSNRFLRTNYILPSVDDPQTPFFFSFL